MKPYLFEIVILVHLFSFFGSGSFTMGLPHNFPFKMFFLCNFCLMSCIVCGTYFFFLMSRSVTQSLHGSRCLRGYLHDTGMTFIPERVYSISMHIVFKSVLPGLIQCDLLVLLWTLLLTIIYSHQRGYNLNSERKDLFVFYV